jgi:acyl-CoA thioester hydrolase
LGSQAAAPGDVEWRRIANDEAAIEQGAKKRHGVHGFEWPVRVYYQDTDAGGIVYHSRFLDFMERARTEWLRSLGLDLSRLAAERQLMFVASSVAIDYLKPARLDDMLAVHAETEKIAGTYIDLNQDIYLGSMQLTRGRVRIACVGTQTLKPSALPREVTSIHHATGSSA